jgi:hypothetical protein
VQPSTKESACWSIAPTIDAPTTLNSALIAGPTTYACLIYSRASCAQLAAGVVQTSAGKDGHRRMVVRCDAA